MIMAVVGAFHNNVEWMTHFIIVLPNLLLRTIFGRKNNEKIFCESIRKQLNTLRRAQPVKEEIFYYMLDSNISATT